MLVPSLRLALRRLAARPGTSALHVGGLAVGLACCFLALLFVRDELSYDRFHDGAERIVSVGKRVQFGDEVLTFTSMPEGGREALAEQVPGIEAITSIGTSQGGLVRRAPEDEGVAVEKAQFVDGSFLDVFSFPLVRGDARLALEGPNRAVLTASLAEALFGTDDPIGRDVYLERTGFGIQDSTQTVVEVTGVAADPPTTTALSFDLLVSGQTPVATFEGTEPAVGPTSPTYVRLASIRDTVAVKAAVEPLALADDSFSAEVLGVTTSRLVDRRLGAEPWTGQLDGRRLYLVLFVAVAALVLLLACVNYANLATALAMTRATEVGVRKTLGAGRGQLVRQFLAEASALVLAAAGLAVGLVALALPAFNALFEKGVALGDLGMAEWATVPVLGLLTSLLAGAYPALVLARFRPVAALRGRSVQGRGGTRVRQALVVFQFAVTAILLVATAVVHRQMDVARTQDLGFDGDRVVALDLGSERLRRQASALKREVEALPGVEYAALGSGVPGAFMRQMGVSPAGTQADRSDDLSTASLDADEAYLDALQFRMAAGTWFTPGAADRGEVILNEAAARRLNLMTTDPAEALGGKVGSAFFEAEDTVVGVVRDFHFEGPRTEIAPLLVEPWSGRSNQVLLAVQLGSADARALEAVHGVWESLFPEYPFDPQFVEDTFAEEMRADRQLGQLFGAFGLVAVVLACLGVFGLAAHAAERRTKEIGIRKALGASVAGLVARLSGEFARLVTIALAIAAPVAVVLARHWLEGFAYPAPLTATPFVLVGLGVLALALCTAGVHAVRAATADPVRALRSE